MDWMRENKTLAAIIGVMVVGSIGLAVVLFTSYSGYTTSLEEYQNVSNSIATAKGAKLFPSEENVQAKEAAVTEYEEAVGRLSTVLMALQQPVKPLTDTEFQARLKTRISEVRQAAQGRTSLPKDFAFGFDSYTSALPRSAEAAAELGDYLAAVDAMVSMIIESGAKSIDSIARTELQIEKGTPPPPPEPPKETKPKKVSSSRSKKGKQTGKQAAPPKEIAKVVERRQVTLTLTADQGPLQFIMNKLASPSQMVHFTIVRQLRVDNEQQEGPLRGSLKRLTPSSGAEEPKAPSEPAPADSAPAPEAQPAVSTAPGAAAVPAPSAPKVIEPAKAGAPDAQAVFGEENLKVYMEIDLVRFLEPKSSDEAR